MSTVVLVEDPPAVLRALRESLARDPGVRVVGEATSLERGLTLAARLMPDIVVVDAEMTDLDASSAILAVSQRVPESALLVLTIEPDRMVGLGTIDIVGKVDGADAALEIFERLRARPWVERTTAELRATGQTRPHAGDSVLDRLTPQELEIVSLAASGLTNKQIAEKLFLSHRTVGSHLHGAFPKLGVATRAALRDALESIPRKQLPRN